MIRRTPPPPNLRGTHDGPCVVCLRGTDTGIAFAGEAEWAVAGIIRLGIPPGQAAAMVSHATGCEPGMVRAGSLNIGVRVCRGCADASGTGITVGLIPDEMPTYASYPIG